jgi:hypothetical protein
MHARINASLLVAALSGCSAGGAAIAPPDLGGTATCASDTRAETYVPGLSQAGKDHLYMVKLMSSDPGPPIKGNNAWVIAVSDAASGAPVDGLSIKVTPFMPDHGHGTQIKAAVTAMGGGQYGLDPVNLFMAGLWQVTIDLTAGDVADMASAATVDQVVFSFCVEG